MLKSLGVVLVWALVATGCSESSTRSFEGSLCSSNSSDSVHYRCDRTFADLICISTYKVNTTDAYVCRVACKTPADCDSIGLVCCQGDTVPNPYGATRGCTTRDKCQTDPAALLPPPKTAPDAGGDPLPPNPTDAAPGTPDAPVSDTAEDSSTDAPQ